MSGHRKFNELTKQFTQEDRKIIEAKKAEMRAEMEAEGSSKTVEKAPKAAVQKAAKSVAS